MSKDAPSTLASFERDAWPNFEVFRQSGGSSPGLTRRTTVVADVDYSGRRLDHLPDPL